MIAIKVNDIKFIEQHFEAVKNFFCRKGIKFNYQKIDTWIKVITGNSFNFEEIIKAKPNEFEIIINRVNAIKKYNKNSNESKYMFYVYKKFSSVNDKDFKKLKYGALKLIDNLGLRVCPYCNRNFITNTKLYDKNNKLYVKRIAQLDHFYPESEFKYLALSFYNLIPSCPSCNMIKWHNSIEVNPYNIQNSDDHIIFDYGFDKSINKTVIDTIYMSKEFEKNWDVLGLEKLYSIHSDYLNDLLFRIKIYNSLYKKDIKDYFNKLNRNSSKDDLDISESDFERIILGNYFIENDLGKQPLAKLTKDIYMQYK